MFLCSYRDSWTGRKLGWVLRLVWILDSFRGRKEVGAGAPDLMSGGVGFAGFLSGLAGPVLMMVCWLHVILGDPYTAMSSIVLSGWKMLLGLLSRVRKSLCSE